ncbi:cobyric acid synthase [Symbioplanes lichenis]|uniref:cobyric acid synthase n=1 Tax=Symbioplanes lichenis TaxID=1629072 RepID=UPI0027392162|nr:cobyric acid synthase [Actinoplanes lichenis]
MTAGDDRDEPGAVLGSPRLILVEAGAGDDVRAAVRWLGQELDRWDLSVRDRPVRPLLHDLAAAAGPAPLRPITDDAALNEQDSLHLIVARLGTDADVPAINQLGEQTRTPVVAVGPAKSFEGLRTIGPAVPTPAPGNAPELCRELLRIAATAPALLIPGGEERAPGRLEARPARRPRARRPARTLMIQGTQSDAGKSFLVTAVLRLLSRAGVRAAPFKAQNISNNARVVNGGELGVAQYVQALAAGVVPDVRMNPILLKPHRDRTVPVVLGRPRPDLTGVPWRFRKPLLWPAVTDALDSLREDFDVIVAEGAGSPAEPGFSRNDVVNMRLARHADAPVLLVADAGRGGAVAHCVGTLDLMTAEDRARVRGVLFNKYFPATRPDHLLSSAEFLRHRYGMTTLGVVPVLDAVLPREDSAALADAGPADGPHIGIVAYPRMANSDEFAAVLRAGARLSWIRHAGAAEGVDLLILPGSRDVQADLAWLRASGLEPVIRERTADGRPILAICGGLQMLGRRIEDPAGVERRGSTAGLGLLPVDTMFRADKAQRAGEFRFGPLRGWWAWLTGLRFSGYEIRHGRSVRAGTGVRPALPGGAGYQHGNILALYVHGLLEDPEVVRNLVGPQARQRPLDDVLDRMADGVRDHIDFAAVADLLS